MSNCARVGRPTGGKKDKEPPISISANPDFNTVNFNENKIVIFFDEYIKFKDLNQQLIISPPLKYTPEISPQGYPAKKITIKIKDTLKDDVTYTLNFGNAIVDNSEGNPLKRFKYLLSTGAFIDSLSVSGFVKDAYLMEQPQNISVLLYIADSTYNDSIIYKKKPNYITNTLDSIRFLIANIKSGRYHLFALKDNNKNLLYDPSEDKIAFLKAPVDASIDSSFQLVLFKEKPSFIIKNISQLSKNHLIIGFAGDYIDFLKKVEDKNGKRVNYTYFKDKETDTVHLWYNDVSSDSLVLSLKQNDTLIKHFQRLRSKEIDSLVLSKNIKSSINPLDSLFVMSNIPLLTIDKKKIQLLNKDSIFIPFNIVDENKSNRFLVDFKQKEDETYTLSLFPEAVTDYLGHQNDSLQFVIKTKKLEEYGEIVFKIDKPENHFIFELITNTGKLVSRKIVYNLKEVRFKFLKPDKYKLRVIIDTNNNNKWDTGNYLNDIMPEKVIYFDKELEIRANWTISEIFKEK
jgi:uncharacterized protein (DUF2141 family)